MMLGRWFRVKRGKTQERYFPEWGIGSHRRQGFHAGEDHHQAGPFPLAAHLTSSRSLLCSLQCRPQWVRLVHASGPLPMLLPLPGMPFPVPCTAAASAPGKSQPKRHLLSEGFSARSCQGRAPGPVPHSLLTIFLLTCSLSLLFTRMLATRGEGLYGSCSPPHRSTCCGDWQVAGV